MKFITDILGKIALKIGRNKALQDALIDFAKAIFSLIGLWYGLKIMLIILIQMLEASAKF